MSNDSDMLYKKRLSSRATGLVWQLADVTGCRDDWIAQERLDIYEEVRIYVVAGHTHDQVAVRQHKTTTQKVKVKGLRQINDEERVLVDIVKKRMQEIDFMGIDVVHTSKGIYLIEVNRSPDFATYQELSGHDLAEDLYSRLENGVGA
jgi:glutathione synthase/RimK-type ligase-like ATP-grasp enzyme